MPFQPSTQLEAVNTMLSTIGEAPVASLTGNLPIDASLALNLLNEVTRDFQTEGWYFNTDVHVTLGIDSNGYIYLGSNVASVSIDRSLTDPRIDPVLQWDSSTGNPKLYDRRNQTFVFTSPLTAAEVVKWLDWTQLPETARRYITIRAARMFGDRQVGADNVHQYSGQDEARALQKFKADDGTAVSLSMLNNTNSQRLLNRSGFGSFTW